MTKNDFFNNTYEQETISRNEFSDCMEKLEDISSEIGALLIVLRDSCENNDYYSLVQVLEIAINKQNILTEQLFMQTLN